MDELLADHIADSLARISGELNQLATTLREQRSLPVQAFVPCPKRDISFAQLREMMDRIESTTNEADAAALLQLFVQTLFGIRQ